MIPITTIMRRVRPQQIRYKQFHGRKLLLLGGATLFLSAGLMAPTPKIYVIGDSTACIYSASLFPRTGWAQVAQQFFMAESVKVCDSALSGRSSKSFYDEGHWTPVKNALRKGDYVIIQFGHNDEKTDDAARGTLPGTTFKHYLSKFIDDAVAKEAIPVLATPIERNSWNGSSLKGSHVTSSGDYPQAIRDLAAEKKIALIDATMLTKKFFEKIGKDSTTRLFMNLSSGEWPNYPNGNSDNTHLTERGAKAVSQLIVDDIVRQKISPLCGWVKNAATVARIPQGTAGKLVRPAKGGMAGYQTGIGITVDRLDLQGRLLGRSSGGLVAVDRSPAECTAGNRNIAGVSLLHVRGKGVDFVFGYSGIGH